MRALIKKYPDNSTKAKQEIMLEPFPECVQADIDDYLDNYHYALCENCPSSEVIVEEIDQRYNLVNYRIESYVTTEGLTRYKAYWIWS